MPGLNLKLNTLLTDAMGHRQGIPDNVVKGGVFIYKPPLFGNGQCWNRLTVIPVNISDGMLLDGTYQSLSYVKKLFQDRDQESDQE